MIERLHVEAGGEYLIPFARKKARDFHVEMNASRLDVVSRVVYVTPTDVIFFNIIRHGKAEFLDTIRIASGAEAGIVQLEDKESPFYSQAFKITNGGVTSAISPVTKGAVNSDPQIYNYKPLTKEMLAHRWMSDSQFIFFPAASPNGTLTWIKGGVPTTATFTPSGPDVIVRAAATVAGAYVFYFDSASEIEYDGVLEGWQPAVNPDGFTHTTAFIDDLLTDLGVINFGIASDGPDLNGLATPLPNCPPGYERDIISNFSFERGGDRLIFKYDAITSIDYSVPFVDGDGSYDQQWVLNITNHLITVRINYDSTLTLIDHSTGNSTITITGHVDSSGNQRVSRADAADGSYLFGSAEATSSYDNLPVRVDFQDLNYGFMNKDAPDTDGGAFVWVHDGIVSGGEWAGDRILKFNGVEIYRQSPLVSVVVVTQWMELTKNTGDSTYRYMVVLNDQDTWKLLSNKVSNFTVGLGPSLYMVLDDALTIIKYTRFGGGGGGG